MKPEDIEIRSFEIIDAEAGPHDFTAAQWRIVQRMIHTSADFEYMQTVRFTGDAVEKGLDAVRRGAAIITDTHMARVGMRQRDLDRFGVTVSCWMTDPAVASAAQDSNLTRAEAAVDASLPAMKDGIYVVGNAPTALLRLIEQVKAGRAQPALIIGLPVGFVNAAESKAALMEMDYPHISNVGRKGGSNVAAAVVNALVKMALNGGAK